MLHSIRFIVVLLTAIPCFAADMVFLKAPQIPGEVTEKGREGSNHVLAFNHEVISPRDAASGLPTGKRQHMPFRFVIRHGKSTPLLFKALSNNEVIPKVEVLFYRPSAIGAEVLYMSYELENVSISSVRPWMPNTQEAAVANFGTQVEVAMTYQKITWTFLDGGITHEDSWEQGR